MKKKKILFLPAGIGLAHVGRCTSLAKELKTRGYDIFFGIGKHSSIVVEKEGFPYQLISEVAWEIYEGKFRKLNPSIYSFEMIEKFVKEELALIRQEKPDLIVADIRPTAKISASIAKIPLVSILNVDASRYYDYSKVKIRFPGYWFSKLSPVLRDIIDSKVSETILKKVAPFFLRTFTLEQLVKFNFVLIKYNKIPLFSFLDFFLGDTSILVDIPQLRPVRKLPAQVHLVGPIFWEGAKEFPNWSNKLNSKKPMIYLTISGTGDKKVCQKIVDNLKDEQYQVVVTVGNVCRTSDIRMPGRSDFFITQFVSGAWIMSKASVIIFPGGVSTAYQALKAGVPQIGIPVNLDQEDVVNQLVRLGTAVMIDPYSFDKKKLLDSIHTVLEEKSFKKSTLKIKKIMLQYNGVKTAADIIEKSILF